MQAKTSKLLKSQQSVDVLYDGHRLMARVVVPLALEDGQEFTSVWILGPRNYPGIRWIPREDVLAT